MTSKKTEFQSRLTSASSTFSATVGAKKLIEVALPMEALNKGGACDKMQGIVAASVIRI